MCKEKYINPFTDFGFKRLFGSASNKEFLISFLNSLFNEDDKIVDINYKNVEQKGYNPDERSAVYDLYCTTDSGSHIIVEMQRGAQRYFKDRTIYYSSFPMHEAAKKGMWDYQLPKIYTVAILDFTLPEYVGSPEFKHVVKLTDQNTGKVFYDKLAYFYLEMPKYITDIEHIEETDFFSIWLFLIKNLHYLDEIPAKIAHDIFLRFFRIAEIMAFTTEEKEAYEASLKQMRDYKNSLVLSKEEGIAIGKEEGIAIGKEEGIAIGKEEGIAIGKIEERRLIIKNMMSAGLNLEQIADILKLTLEEVKSISLHKCR